MMEKANGSGIKASATTYQRGVAFNVREPVSFFIESIDLLLLNLKEK